MSDFDKVKDSGSRRDFGTGSVRDQSSGKGRYDLLEPVAIRRLAQHFENGAVKYGDNNWQLGQPLSVYLDSAIRHLFNLLEGKQDEDHAAAAAWNALAFISTKNWIDEGTLPAELDNIAWQEVEEQVPATEIYSGNGGLIRTFEEVKAAHAKPGGLTDKQRVVLANRLNRESYTAAEYLADLQKFLESNEASRV